MLDKTLNVDVDEEPSSAVADTHVEPPRKGWKQGFFRATPIILGYVPIGLAYGMLAQKSGLSALNTVLMSILVFAGSAQLISVGMFAVQAPALSIIMTTFIVNLRHFMMASAIAPHLKRWRKFELAAFAYQLTDETFAVHSAQFSSEVPEKAEVFATNITAQTAWLSGTILGVVIGQAVTDVRPFAFDYALPAMFVVLLVLQIKQWIHVVVAMFTGILAVVLLQAGMTQWNVMAATIIGATIGIILEQWTNRSSS